jgi:hypothetical protein
MNRIWMNGPSPFLFLSDVSSIIQIETKVSKNKEGSKAFNHFFNKMFYDFFFFRFLNNINKTYEARVIYLMWHDGKILDGT